MTKYVVVSKPNPHLPHDSVELQSPPPADALTPEIAEKNAELIISRLMRELERPCIETEAPPRKPCAEAPAAPAAPETPAPACEPEDRTEARAEERPARPPRDDVEANIRAALNEDNDFEPEEIADRRRARRLRFAAIGALIGATMLWPVLMGAVALVLVWLALLAAMMLRRAVANGRWQRFAARHPKTAESLRRTADRIALRLDRVLDLLPAHWAESLALPDLSQPVRPEARSG